MRLADFPPPPGCGLQTLGEEYCDLLHVSSGAEGLPPGAMQRGLLVLLQAVRLPQACSTQFLCSPMSPLLCHFGQTMSGEAISKHILLFSLLIFFQCLPGRGIFAWMYR